uniref:Phospholipase A2 n=1 Tax=Paramormyrops kingsleyae TaxID=1676925 RepID=A0A3B3S080_9TELE
MISTSEAPQRLRWRSRGWARFSNTVISRVLTPRRSALWEAGSELQGGDLEDYGCSCRYLGGRGTVDDMDGCCFRHRGCYRAVTERGCRSQPDTTTYSVTCGHSNVTCGKGTDPCARDWCLCDKAAIECMGRSPYHPSWRHLDSASCSSGPATGNCSVPRFTNYISQNPPLAFKTCKTIMFVKYTFCK